MTTELQESGLVHQGSHPPCLELSIHLLGEYVRLTSENWSHFSEEIATLPEGDRSIRVNVSDEVVVLREQLKMVKREKDELEKKLWLERMEHEKLLMAHDNEKKPVQIPIDILLAKTVGGAKSLLAETKASYKTLDRRAQENKRG